VMGRGSQSGLRFGLLGPPILYDGHDGADGRSGADSQGNAGVRVVGSRKLRILLAALLLEAGRVVSAEALKDALWGSTPPASAKASLHNHVSRLRRLLDDPDRLRAVAPGYLLRVAPGELDVQVFESHAARARGAHADGNWTETVHACAAALALWRGAPLSGVPSELAGYALVQRLEEARLLLLEWRYDAELALASTRPDALVPELSALAAEHPLHESYHRQLMLALHRTGRHAEALAVCRTALGQPPVETPVPLTWQTVCAQQGDAHPERCPTCGQRLVCTSVIPRGGAPPPLRAGEYAA